MADDINIGQITEALNDKADNTSVVHNTGNETIAGTKTFTAQYLQVKNTAGTGGSGISIFDSNQKGSSNLEQYYTNGNYYTRLVSRNATANKYAYIEIVSGDDGTMRFANANLNSMSAPTPASTSNGTDIATTAWVNNAAVHKTGDETIAGVKTFSSAPILNSATASTVPVLSSTKQIVSSAVTATELGYLDGVTSAIQTQLNNKAPKASPAFTGTPTAPTAGSSTNNTQIATTAFVKSVLSSSGNGLATFSKAQNGYYKFNNGLIIQWGRIAAEVAGSTGSVTFPTPFTSDNASVQIEIMAVGNGKLARVTSITKTGFGYEADQFGSPNPTAQKTWLAIGY